MILGAQLVILDCLGLAILCFSFFLCCSFGGLTKFGKKGHILLPGEDERAWKQNPSLRGPTWIVRPIQKWVYVNCQRIFYIGWMFHRMKAHGAYGSEGKHAWWRGVSYGRWAYTGNGCFLEKAVSLMRYVWGKACKIELSLWEREGHQQPISP